MQFIKPIEPNTPNCCNAQAFQYCYTLTGASIHATPFVLVQERNCLESFCPQSCPEQLKTVACSKKGYPKLTLSSKEPPEAGMYASKHTQHTHTHAHSREQKRHILPIYIYIRECASMRHEKTFSCVWETSTTRRLWGSFGVTNASISRNGRPRCAVCVCAVAKREWM